MTYVFLFGALHVVWVFGCIEFIGFRLGVAVPFKGAKRHTLAAKPTPCNLQKIALHSTLT
jgi:hypothetical protein|tara:strand:+ start:343 stop:522 length:180 start_codon:yes stop_codon:yes gene_type:complete